MCKYSPKVQAWDPGRANVSIQVQRQEKNQYLGSKAVKQEKFPLLSLFILFMHSTDWMSPSSGWAVCFTKSTDSNVQFTQNTFTDRIMFDRILGYPVAQSGWHTKWTIAGTVTYWAVCSRPLSCPCYRQDPQGQGVILHAQNPGLPNDRVGFKPHFTWAYCTKLHFIEFPISELSSPHPSFYWNAEVKWHRGDTPHYWGSPASV